MLLTSTRTLLAIGVCLPLLSACGQAFGQRSPDIPTLANGGALGAARDVRTFHYTRAISAESRPGYTLVTIDPGGAGRWRLRYALVPRGSEPRVDDKEATIIEVPLRRVIVVPNNGVLQYLEDLGVSDTVVGVTNSSWNYPWLTRLHQRDQAGAVADIQGEDGISLERVLDLAPDLTLIDFTAGSALWPLARGGVPGIALAIRLERHPLAAAEWIKLLGLLFGREREASAQFTRIEDRYRTLASLVAQAPRRPRVLPSGVGGTWSERDVQRQLVVDAGGIPIPSDPGAWHYFYQYPYEVILDQGVDADVWPWGQYRWKTRDDIVRADARLAAFRAVREGRVYHQNRRMQPGIVDPSFSAIYLYPDTILADLIRIFHPEVLPNHEFTYFQQIGGGE
jgi:iron complex transport system substrate-binding protein